METPLDEIDCLARSNHRAGVMSVDLLADAVASYPAGYLYEQIERLTHLMFRDSHPSTRSQIPRTMVV